MDGMSMRTSERRTLRVLAADDSAVMRGVLRTVFRLHAEDRDSVLPAMELCGVVNDGIEALEAVRRLRPDVLLLDLEMPRLSGLGVLKRLREEAQTLPVIMCSAYTETGARSTLDALAQGAKDYVTKPGQQRDFAAALDLLMQQLLPKIAALALIGEVGSSDRATQSDFVRAQSAPGGEAAAEELQISETHPVEVVVIGVSTGGPSALEVVLPLLPPDFAVPVLIVQHMPKLFTAALADRLDRICGLRVRQATDGAAIKPGTIWLAPGDAHMEIGPRPGRGSAASGSLIRLHQDVPLNSCKPSVDYLFRSAARHCGAATLALVMTGMGSDGLEGAALIRQAGGEVLAQDQASSAVWGMPGRVAQAGIASAILPLTALASALRKRVNVGRGTILSSLLPGARSLTGWRAEPHGML